MNTAQRIVKNTFSLLFSSIFAQFISFFVVVYLARILGPGDFGKISFAITITIYFTLIINLGLPLLGTREIARDREKINDYLNNILTMRLCLAALSFGLLLLMTFFLNKWCLLPLPISIVFAIALTTVAGSLIELLVYRPIRRKKASPLVLLLSSLGVFVVIQNLVSLVFGDAVRSIRTGAVEKGMDILGVRITPVQALIVSVCVVLVASVWVFGLANHRMNNCDRIWEFVPQAVMVGNDYIRATVDNFSNLLDCTNSTIDRYH